MAELDFLAEMLSLKTLLEDNKVDKALELVNELVAEAKKVGSDKTGKTKIYTIDEIKQKVAPIAKKYNIEKVYLFGSYARGEANEDSDVDLLLDYKKLGGGMFAYGGVYVDFEDCFEKGIDIVSQSVIEANRSKSEAYMFFYNNVMKDRVLIYG